MRSKKGFTLIELLITLAIMGLLATVTVPLAQLHTQRKNEQILRSALKEIRTAIDQYKRASDEGRIPRNIGASGYPPNLNILVEGVLDQRSPVRLKLFFLRRLPRDPFNSDGSISDEATWGKRAYASEADNPKEGSDVYDVYTTNTNVGLNGIAYRRW
ncbi:MAG: type II secretion system GspH family protein [Undibacterium sp.]|nr:type II secretion system GspH family protein [Undibacterium sp.]